MQSDSREVLPVLLVMWPEGHWRQEAEPEAGWYLLMGHSIHTEPSAQIWTSAKFRQFT